MNFASDNTAGVAPEIMAALSQANEGFTLGYGNDAWTKRAEQRIADVFKRDIAAFFVTTGTACNSLAIAHFAPPWGAVLCHENAHIATDECGAPEFFWPRHQARRAARRQRQDLPRSPQDGA